MTRTYLLWALIPIFSTLYQFFSKLTAHHMEGTDFGLIWLTHATSTPWIWAALVSEIASFIIWMKILSVHDLSKAFPLSAISYVLVLCIGWFFFDETILPLQILGGALILAGVWMIATAHTTKKGAL